MRIHGNGWRSAAASGVGAKVVATGLGAANPGTASGACTVRLACASSSATRSAEEWSAEPLHVSSRKGGREIRGHVTLMK